MTATILSVVFDLKLWLNIKKTVADRKSRGTAWVKDFKRTPELISFQTTVLSAATMVGYFLVVMVAGITSIPLTTSTLIVLFFATLRGPAELKLAFVTPDTNTEPEEVDTNEQRRERF